MRFRTQATIARINMATGPLGLSGPQVAEKFFGPKGRDGYVEVYTKAPVDSSGTDGPMYTAAGTLKGQYADSVREPTILGRLSVTNLPFGVWYYINSRTRGKFTGERMPIAVTAPDFGTLTLDRLKISALIVLTNELLMHKESEQVIDREIKAALVEGADEAFLDAAAAVAQERPASVLHGMTEVDATGAATAEDFEGVINDLFTAVTGANLLTSAFVTTPEIALALSQLRNGDLLAYPGITALGGTLAGLPLLTSESAPPNQLALIDGREVLVADDRVIEMATSEHAFIDQNSEPTGTTRTSMFQEESTALRATWRINWVLRRPYAAYATNFAPPVSSFTGSP